MLLLKHFVYLAIVDTVIFYAVNVHQVHLDCFPKLSCVDFHAAILSFGHLKCVGGLAIKLLCKLRHILQQDPVHLFLPTEVVQTMQTAHLNIKVLVLV